MKAILMTATGTPDVLKLAEVETPTLTDDHPLLVRPKAAGGNPVDTKRRKGIYYPERLPAILGCDGTGVVEAVGAAVTRFRPCDASAMTASAAIPAIMPNTRWCTRPRPPLPCTDRRWGGAAACSSGRRFHPKGVARR